MYCFGKIESYFNGGTLFLGVHSMSDILFLECSFYVVILTGCFY